MQFLGVVIRLLAPYAVGTNLESDPRNCELFPHNELFWLTVPLKISYRTDRFEERQQTRRRGKIFFGMNGNISPGIQRRVMFGLNDLPVIS